MPGRLNKRRAIAQLEQARLHAERGEWDLALALLPAVQESGFDAVALPSLWGEALRQLGRRAEARTVLEAGLRRFPRDAELEGRLGALLLDLDEVDAALELLSRVVRARPREPQALTWLAAALVRGGRLEEAEAPLARALLVGAGNDARLVLALVKARRGLVEDADALAAQVEAQAARAPSLLWAARALRADLRLLGGDAPGALAAWEAIEAAGFLDASSLAHMAWAAQAVGASARAEALIARRLAQGPDAQDLLLFAQIANLRGEPERALGWLEQASAVPGHHDAIWPFELNAARGRALRLCGRRDEAQAALELAAAQPEASRSRFGAGVAVDLGHLAAERGDFLAAEAHFRHALALDPGEPEARRALALTSQKVAWKAELAATAERRVEAAKTEAEALRRRFLSREAELAQLRHELERLKVARASAEAEVRRVQAAAEADRARHELEQRARLKDELEARARDVEAKATETLALAFGDVRARCPEPIFQMLTVAERTYQQALYTALPAAAVAVLFSGALERSLVELLVRPFDRWLEDTGRRAAFLDGGVRERRGRRVEYFDRFFEAFDRDEGRTPALGEVSRVLERRREPYLRPFAEFLGARFDADDAFWDELARFVTWSKETLRDPVAHGRLELDWEGLRQFRERLLLVFAGGPPGALPRLLSAARP